MAKEVNPRNLQALKEKLPGILEEGRANGHDVDADPYLQLDQAGLCRRYLIATDGSLEEAAKRLRATIAFRRDWRMLEYHKPGVAQQLFSEATNPGSEMYFGPSGHVDRLGRPYMIGRANYVNGANMHPWRHLRAGLMVVERMAVDVLRRGCGYGSYILDIGEVPGRGAVSATGGKGKGQEAENPYYRRGAGREAPACLLRQFGEPGGGMAVLKVALTVANLYYPELLSRVVVLKSNWLFGAAFRVFSLWVHRRTREKFVFVGGGWTNPPMSKLLEWYSPEELPEEWGGTGWRLDGDSFLSSGIQALDADPALPREVWVEGFAGLDEGERALAEKDARERAAERGQVFAERGQKAPPEAAGPACGPPALETGGPKPGSSGPSVGTPRSCCAPCFVRPKGHGKRRRRPSEPPLSPVQGPTGSSIGALSLESGHAGKSLGKVHVIPAENGLGARKSHRWKVVATAVVLFTATTILHLVTRAAQAW